MSSRLFHQELQHDIYYTNHAGAFGCDVVWFGTYWRNVWPRIPGSSPQDHKVQVFRIFGWFMTIKRFRNFAKHGVSVILDLHQVVWITIQYYVWNFGIIFIGFYKGCCCKQVWHVWRIPTLAFKQTQVNEFQSNLVNTYTYVSEIVFPKALITSLYMLLYTRSQTPKATCLPMASQISWVLVSWLPHSGSQRLLPG